MSKRYWLLIGFLLLSGSVAADQPATHNPPLEITEEDGAPSTFPYQAKFTNGSVTDNGDGTTSISNAGISGGSCGTTNAVAYFSAATTLACDSGLTFAPTNDQLTLTSAATTQDVQTITATSLTSGTGLTLTGPSGATAGMTDALVKVTGDLGSTGLSNGLVSVNATLDSSTFLASSVGLYLGVNHQSTGTASSGNGLYMSFQDTSLSAFNGFGIRVAADQTVDSATTITGIDASTSSTSTTANSIRGGQFAASHTGAISTGDKSVFGLTGSARTDLTTDTGGTITTYGLYFSALGNTGGTSTTIGVRTAASGADANYALITEGGNIGFGDATPDDAFVTIDGSADTPQLLVQGHSTQTNPLATFENSAGTDQVTISNTGVIVASDLTCTDCITLTTETAGNYVATVADGTGIDGTASGEGTTYTPTFDATELSDLTWGAAGGTYTWTFDAGLNDSTIDFASSLMTFGPAANRVRFMAGTEASPGINFTNGTTSGLYIPSANILGIVGNGTEVIRMDADQIGLFDTAIAAANLISSTVSNTGVGTQTTFMRVDDTYDPSSAPGSRMIILDFAGVNDQAGTTLGVGQRLNMSKTSDGTNGNLALWVQGGFTGSSNTSSFANTGVQFVVTNCTVGNCTGGTVTYTDILGHNTPTGYDGSGGTLVYNAINFEAGNILFNQDSEAYDLDMNGDTDANLVVVSGGDDAVGFGESAPTIAAKVEIDTPDASSLTTQRGNLLSDTSTLTINSGSTVATMYHNRFLAPTINGVAGGGTETVTDAATVYIDNEPSGTNVTHTNGPYALFVDAGDSRFDGAVDFQAGLTTTTISASSTIKSTAANDIGWTVANAANQACNTTCTTGACVVGLDTSAVGNFLACTDATADTCLCGG